MVWPVDVRRWLSDRHGQHRSAPALHPDCEAHRGRPRIVHPEPDDVLLLIPGLPLEEQEVALEGTHGAPAQVLSWFVDGRLVGRAPADGRVWWTPSPGRHELVLVDEGGWSTSRELEVRTVPGRTGE